MAKVAGIGWTKLDVDDAGGTLRDIRSDVTNFNFSTPRGVQDVTGIGALAHERLLLLADFSMSLNGVMNTSANKSHAVLSTVPSSPNAREVEITVEAQTMNTEVIFTDYALQRAADGGLTFSAPAVLSNGAVPTWGT